ncbi:MAG: glycosylase, partial [Bacteroidetes bacterium]|nr:glycosylase [Bacteroidota bacterium]
MKTALKIGIILLLLLSVPGCKNRQKTATENFNKEEFPKEMVEFVPYEANPVFEGTGQDTWDKKIRERGYILFEDGIYKMWYTGYKGDDADTKFLGYATSADGKNWTRYPDNPIFSDCWTEDMQVVIH